MRHENNNRMIRAFLNFSIAAVILAGGFFLGSILSPTPTIAAGSVVGFVNVDKLVEEHPGWDAIAPKIKAFEEKEMAKLDKYSGDKLTPEQKKASLDLAIQIRDTIQAKRKELTKPLIDDILSKAKIVGKQIGVEVVLDGAIVLYGGLDLTPAVFNALEANL
jgi:Skp family chaperone for outer membrane proteins